jgi:hypothetical protein
MKMNIVCESRCYQLSESHVRFRHSSMSLERQISILTCIMGDLAADTATLTHRHVCAEMHTHMYTHRPHAIHDCCVRTTDAILLNILGWSRLLWTILSLVGRMHWLACCQDRLCFTERSLLKLWTKDSDRPFDKIPYNAAFLPTRPKVTMPLYDVTVISLRVAVVQLLTTLLITVPEVEMGVFLDKGIQRVQSSFSTLLGLNVHSVSRWLGWLCVTSQSQHSKGT